MKKAVALLIACAISLTLFGCGKKAENKSGNDQAEEETTQAADKDDDESSESDTNVKFSQKGDKTVFTIEADFGLQQDAWLGFCPGTKGYTKEADADEFDVLYTYYEENSSGKNYIFQFDTASIDALDDGDYVLVLCDSDDENVGKVVFYIPAKLDGSKVTLDYDKIVINK